MSDRKKGLRIGLVTPSWPGTNTANGISTAVLYLTQGLQQVGNQVTIIALSLDVSTPDSSPVLVQRRPSSLFGKVVTRFGGKASRSRLLAQRIAEAVNRAIERDGIEILVMEETQGWAATVQAQVSIPVVVTLHGPWFLHKRLQSKGNKAADRRRERLEERAMMTCAGITAPSRDVLEATQTELNLPPIPQRVIPNPIPLRPASSFALMPRKERESFLFVGRFDRHKGGDTVLQAFEIIAAEQPSCQLTFVGPDRGIVDSDGNRRHITEALKALPENCQQSISYRGLCSQDEIDALRQSHGVTIVASRYENLNYTLLEAMASGSAIICTDVGGPGEILRHEETALLVPPGDPKALADACLRLLNNGDLAERLGQNARSFVQEYILPEVIGAQMTTFLTEVLEAFPSTPK